LRRRELSGIYSKEERNIRHIQLRIREISGIYSQGGGEYPAYMVEERNIRHI
jgi:hypothetical protein